MVSHVPKRCETRELCFLCPCLSLPFRPSFVLAFLTSLAFLAFLIFLAFVCSKDESKWLYLFQSHVKQVSNVFSALLSCGLFCLCLFLPIGLWILVKMHQNGLCETGEQCFLWSHLLRPFWPLFLLAIWLLILRRWGKKIENINVENS